MVDAISQWLERSALIPGWLRSEGAREMANVVLRLPPECTIVEIGAFMGSTTILLAGLRKSCGSGVVHCVDPFDGSGDSFRSRYTVNS
jgi:hypothetical protein